MKNVKFIFAGLLTAFLMSASPLLATNDHEGSRNSGTSVVNTQPTEQNDQFSGNKTKIDDSSLSGLGDPSERPALKKSIAKKSSQDQPATVIYISSGPVVVILIILLIILL